MRAGRLDRRITIQRATTGLSASGAPVAMWTQLAARWASIAPLKGEERFSAPQLAAREQVEIRIRWSAAVADLDPRDRIVYPALAADSPPGSPADEPDEARLYDILAVHEIGRRDALRIIAARRVDGTA